MADETETRSIAGMTARIVSAYVAHNRLEPGEIAQVIQAVASHLKALEAAEQGENTDSVQPAANPRRSINRDSLVCLVCGRKQKALKRHLSKAHGLSPSAYREMFNLRADYPMVAPNTSKRRSQIARSIGLGRRDAASGTGKVPQKARSKGSHAA